ncbi:hypothetical protein HORIV_29000 [Vreelandella olivaria]|uniref:Uncharacterized protein n=1 Tax=Vreelandella olivaria TaxID=390919 RepID=A0ABN5WU29_9GAMM|nr:hypothetical protein HORIV_29000 [Halomonas olivaria]
MIYCRRLTWLISLCLTDFESKLYCLAVVQGLENYEKTAEKLQFVKAVAQGLMDVCEGNTVSREGAKATIST